MIGMQEHPKIRRHSKHHAPALHGFQIPNGAYNLQSRSLVLHPKLNIRYHRLAEHPGCCQASKQLLLQQTLVSGGLCSTLKFPISSINWVFQLLSVSMVFEDSGVLHGGGRQSSEMDHGLGLLFNLPQRTLGCFAVRFRTQPNIAFPHKSDPRLMNT